MVIVRAPVRISFGGGGTDLAAWYMRHGGFVVSAAISRYASVMAYRPDRGGIRITSADFNQREEFPAGEIPRVCEPLSLPKAAIARFARHGLAEHGIDLLLASEVPPGTGLGSSSAMTVALVRAIAAVSGLPLDAASAAEIACSVEIEYLGMPIGKQDQYAASFGGLNTIEFSSDGVRVTPLPIASTTRDALDERLLLFSTGTQRHSSSILARQRDDSRNAPQVVEALQRIKALAWTMADALVAGDLDGFGQLLHEGWCQKKQLSPRISSIAIDEWYDQARAAGAIGGKITGAGGGGFLLLYCPVSRQRRLRATMGRLGLQEMPFQFDDAGARVLSGSAGGANESLEPPPCLRELVSAGARLGEDYQNA